jgi:hypothetical protein
VIVHPSLGQAEDTAASFGPQFLGSLFYRSLDGVRVLTFTGLGAQDVPLEPLLADLSALRLRRFAKAAVDAYDRRTLERALALRARKRAS